MSSPTPAQAAYLDALETFKAPDWLAWVEAIVFFQPRRPVPPTGSAEPFKTLTYTHNLLFRYRSPLIGPYQQALIQLLFSLPVHPSAAEAYYDLIEVLTSVKPARYRQPLLDLITNEVSGLHTLTFMGHNIQARLLNIYIYLDDGLDDPEKPNPFVAYLYRNTAGNKPVHPAPEFPEYALRYFALRRYSDYFLFMKRVSRVYAEPAHAEYICNALMELVNYKSDAFRDLYNWFKNDYLRSFPDPDARLAVKRTLAAWLENENFFDNDVFALLLYAELAAGVRPPVAGLLKLVCGLPVPDLVDKPMFDTERLSTLGRWVDATNRNPQFFENDYLIILHTILDPICHQTEWDIELKTVNRFINFEETADGYVLQSHFSFIEPDEQPNADWTSQYVLVTEEDKVSFQEMFDIIGLTTTPRRDRKMAEYFREYADMTSLQLQVDDYK